MVSELFVELFLLFPRTFDSGFQIMDRLEVLLLDELLDLL